MTQLSTESLIRNLALKHFDQVGFSPAGRPSTMDHYDQWLAEGLHGDMAYLARHRNRKADPQSLLKGARSWIALTLSYDTQEPLSIELMEAFKRNRKGWIARYARGGDYHVEIRKRLDALIALLREEFPGHEFVGCVDIQAVLEREVAASAGIGWIGKNTCLINQDAGSFLFLAEILTTLELSQDKPVMDHCGTCTRCLDACPTGALIAPRKLDATKCISYWTIESKVPAPAVLSARFGVNIFGCDICQDVCPWNQKSRRLRDLPPAPDKRTDVDLETVASMNDSQIAELLSGSAMERTKPAHFKKSVEAALENLKK
jgi:epoxyqueuosine reductase